MLSVSVLSSAVSHSVDSEIDDKTNVTQGATEKNLMNWFPSDTNMAQSKFQKKIEL
jgi:hypothetical protein